ncbi:MAG: SAM-dependent methyltransferase, partial [Halobacteriovoraceae bacterium]|nr:SAM-dependent methyltransferase [Halobacteriovoraceae bacterium]
EKLKDQYSQDLKKICDFLAPYELLWSEEVLNDYPKTMGIFEPAWLSEIQSWSLDQEWKVDCGVDLEKLAPSSLRDLFLKIKSLEEIPRWPKTIDKLYPSWALFKVGGKKQHEIQKIIPLLETLNLKPGDSFVDIGGGKGHLSRILCLYHGLNGVTLDTNQEFQSLGKSRLEKYKKPEDSGELSFVHHTFGGESCKEKEDRIFQKAKVSFGLHTCGPLALNHLSKIEQQKGLLNFGCCYQRMNVKEDTVLSQFCRKQAPLPLTKFSMTLASRGHTSISLEDYGLKKKVKKMRAALHFFMIKEGLQEGFVKVGSAHPRLYNQSFEDYALHKIQELGLNKDFKVSKASLKSFWEEESLQKTLDDIYKASLVRWRFGRILEKYVLYDRALKYVEEGHPVEVYQFFDESLSPRNIGLLKRV